MPNKLDPLLLLTWPVADPFESALWVGSLAAAAQRTTAFLDEELTQLAEQCLERWRPRAKA